MVSIRSQNSHSTNEKLALDQRQTPPGERLALARRGRDYEIVTSMAVGLKALQGLCSSGQFERPM